MWSGLYNRQDAILRLKALWHAFLGNYNIDFPPRPLLHFRLSSDLNDIHAHCTAFILFTIMIIEIQRSSTYCGSAATDLVKLGNMTDASETIDMSFRIRLFLPPLACITNTLSPLGAEVTE